jgi:putative PIN family toxin of toxin-antitoxin system
MIRVVLDTNILISALLQPQGVPARTFLISLAGITAQLCVSGDIYSEYEEVLRRAKFNRSEAAMEAALRAIRKMDSGSNRPRGACLFRRR